MKTNSPNPVDGDVIKELRSRYAEPKIPSCRICGGELSVQRSGGGSPTIWACSGMIDDPTGERNWIYAEGRSCADEHYERSRWTDYRSGGDSDVIDLIDAYQALLDERLNATAQPVSDGWAKCSERMPESGVVVLVYTPPQACDLPGDVRINFDWIDAESDNPKLWYQHNEQHEYFCHVATGESSFGPSEIAPYTHWMPLPAAPGGKDD